MSGTSRITAYCRDWWPSRPRLGLLILVFGLVLAAAGGLVVWAYGDTGEGAAFGFLAGCLIALVWIFAAVATSARSSSRRRMAQQKVYVKPNSHVNQQPDTRSAD